MSAITHSAIHDVDISAVGSYQRFHEVVEAHDDVSLTNRRTLRSCNGGGTVANDGKYS